MDQQAALIAKSQQHTIAKTVEETTEDELREAVCRELEDSTNSAEKGTDTESVLATKFLAEQSCQEAAQKIAELGRRQVNATCFSVDDLTEKQDAVMP